MELIAFRARHFRCLHQTDWIPFDDITVLIGENDGGKTATIDALNTLLGGRPPDAGDFAYKASEQAQEAAEIPREQDVLLEARFRLAEDEADRVRAAAPLAQFEPGELYVLRRATLDDAGPSIGPLKVKARTPADPRLQRDTEALRREDLAAFVDEHGIEVEGPKSRKDSFIEAILRSAQRVSWMDGEVEVARVAQLGLPIFTVFPASLNPEQVVSQGLSSIFRQEIQGDDHQGRLEEIRGSIGAVLDTHVANLIPYVRKYRQDITEVRVTPLFDFESGFKGATLQLIGQDSRPIALQKRGLGMQRQVTLAVYEWNTDVFRGRADEGARPVILAFDEPDLHLDYGSQRQLFQIIADFAGPGIQVVVATHSLNFVNRVPVNKLNYYSLDSSQHTTVEHLPSGRDAEELFLFQVGAGMGLDNSLMFYERCFLVVEGATEMGALPRLFEQFSETTAWSEGIRFLNGENNGGVRLFAKFLNQSRRNVVFLVDEDARTNPESERLFTEERLAADGFDLDTQVHFLGPREFEEAFGDELWAKVGDTYYPRDDGQHWEPRYFAEMRSDPNRRFKHSLLRAFRTDPTTLGVRLAGCVDSQADIPEGIRSCFRNAREIANRTRQRNEATHGHDTGTV